MAINWGNSKLFYFGLHFLWDTGEYATAGERENEKWDTKKVYWQVVGGCFLAAYLVGYFLGLKRYSDKEYGLFSLV